jgi:NAD(P)-dependent dehydrogenase (short-subunit alcohol dehydrogenase family)
MQFAGKVVLVTGAQQGIGRAMALEFASAGADIAINWLDGNGAAQSVSDEVRACRRRAILVQADVGQIAQVQAMVSAVQEGLGGIDVLINNAGVFPRVPFLEMTERDWDHVLDVNLKGSCFCAQSVAKAMIASERQGAIINIASGAALHGSPRGVHYVASKGGILSLILTMRPIILLRWQ